MLSEESQAQTQKEEDELNKLAVKRNKIIAIVINVVFAVLFCTVAMKLRFLLLLPVAYCLVFGLSYIISLLIPNY